MDDLDSGISATRGQTERRAPGMKDTSIPRTRGQDYQGLSWLQSKFPQEAVDSRWPSHSDVPS